MDRYADGDYHIGQMLESLCNHRRRIFIRYLEANEPAELKDVAKAIAKIEGCSQKSAYTSLYQTHAKTLLRAEIIQQHNGTKTYEQGQHFTDASVILAFCDTL